MHILIYSFYPSIYYLTFYRIDVTSNDPRWVGAWWIGFAVSAVASITVVMLLACFAKELPGLSICLTLSTYA